MSPLFGSRLRMRLARLFWPHVSPLPVPAEPTFSGDGLLTANGSDFLSDENFQRVYAAAKATGSWWHHDLQWRAYVIGWAALHGSAQRESLDFGHFHLDRGVQERREP